MSEWKKLKIGGFLKVREGKYKPTDLEISNLRRLEKIDFDGNIHLSDKPTKTDMIIVNSGDLVISGINVAKGAIAIYQGEQPITATIHYSSYQFDNSIIDIDFLKHFLRSPAFISALKDQVKGGIKTEIKAKTLLSIVVQLPSLSEQKVINRRFQTFENELVQLALEINKQQSYLTKLRQAILQEAIEGKLTADWRAKNPVKKGDPNTDAAALLATIKAEKQKLIAEGKIKQEKPLAPINPDDVPFVLPDGWVWCRLSEVKKQHIDCPHATPLYLQTGKACLRASNITPMGITFAEKRYVSESEYSKRIERLQPQKNDLVYIREGGRLGIAGLINIDEPCCLGQRLMLIRFFEDATARYGCYFINAPSTYQIALNTFSGAASPHINVRDVINNFFPLPPLAEQHAIVERVDRLLNYVNALEQQVIERKSYAEQLMQAVLKEAFA